MKNILLTGSTGNLGTIVVKSLSEAGYYLHLPVRNNTGHDAENTATYPLSLIDSDESEALLQKITQKNKSISAGVFLAGGFQPGDLEHTKLADINQMIQTNFGTAYILAQKLITHFRSVGGGKLIFIGAASAMDFKTASNNLAYSLSKQLLFNFSRLINESEKSFGITSHILLPNAIGVENSDNDSSDLTSPYTIADTIKNIIEGQEKRTAIPFNDNRMINLGVWPIN